MKVLKSSELPKHDLPLAIYAHRILPLESCVIFNDEINKVRYHYPNPHPIKMCLLNRNGKTTRCPELRLFFIVYVPCV